MTVISVVIPVHGVEDYLDRCLDSVLGEPAVAGLPPAQRLGEAALQRSGRDNITALVVELAERGEPAAEGR